MKHQTWVMIVVAMTALTHTTEAFDKTGTTAATFLQITSSSRVAAMGGAGVALPGGAEMLAVNPAAVSAQAWSTAFSYSDWFAGLEHQTLAVTAPVRPGLRVGLHAVSFGGDEFEQTTVQQQEGTGLMVDYGDLALGGSAILQLTDRFTVGITGKYIRQDLFNTYAHTAAVDIGTLLNTSLDGFRIGMAMSNLGGDMQLSGRDLITDPVSDEAAETRLQTSSWPLPLTFQTGVAWTLLDDEGFWRDDTHTVTLAADGRHLNEGVTTLHLGMEYGFRDLIQLRGGRTVNHDTEGWAFGAGVHIPLHQWTVSADFAYADLGDLNTVKRVTVHLAARD